MQGLDGFSEAEVLDLYAQSFPLERKAARRERLRERQRQLLYRLERQAAKIPFPSYLVSGWFDAVTASKLTTAGIVLLNELSARIAAGCAWYRALPAIGTAKAARIARHLAMLLPRQVSLPRAVFSLNATPAVLNASLPVVTIPFVGGISDSNVNAAHPLLNASNDLDAVEAWIKARAGSSATAKAYLREARRLLLWLQYECRGAMLGQMTVEDCSNFLAFLQHIPAC